MAEAPPLYRPDGWDEAVDPQAGPRPGYEALLGELAAADLASLQARLADELERRGVGFLSSVGEEVFHVDPVPRLAAAAEWDELEAGLRQRSLALNEFIRDAYGARAIVAEGVLPERVIASADHFEQALRGRPPAGWGAPIIGFDLVRGADGRLVVLEDNTRTPSGFAYAVAAREALADAGLPLAPPPRIADPAECFALLSAAIEDAAPAGAAAVLLSDGPSNGAWFEHREIARRLELPLVTPAELSRDGSRLSARIGGERTEVGFVYRRTDEDRLFDEAERATDVGELLLEPVREGGLVVWNGFGAGIADDKLVHAYVEQMIGFYLGEEPLLASVRSYDLAREEAREEALARLRELVIKPRAGLGGRGVVICAHADDDDVARIGREIRARPDAFIAQETIALSTHPTVAGAGLEPRHVDLRAFTIAGELAPAPLTRFARERGALVVNSSEGGGAKDTWVLR